MVCYSFEFLLKKSSYGLLSARSNSLQTPLSLTLPEHLQTERNLQSICFIANFRRDKVKTNEALVSAVKFYSGTPQSLPPWSGLGKPRERLFFFPEGFRNHPDRTVSVLFATCGQFQLPNILGLEFSQPKKDSFPNSFLVQVLQVSEWMPSRWVLAHISIHFKFKWQISEQLRSSRREIWCTQ